MAAQNRTDLLASFAQSGSGNFPDNTTRYISPARLRLFVEAIIESAPNILDDTYLSYMATTPAGADTYTATVVPTISAYTSGQMFVIKFTTANTGASTININTLGAKSIVKQGSIALSSGDISTGQILILIYDGTNMQIVGSSAGGGGDGITVALWSFPSGAFPTSANVLYIATADHGSIGDPDYVAQGTWFIATTTPSGYSDFNYK